MHFITIALGKEYEDSAGNLSEKLTALQIVTASDLHDEDRHPDAFIQARFVKTGFAKYLPSITGAVLLLDSDLVMVGDIGAMDELQGVSADIAGVTVFKGRRFYPGSYSKILPDAFSPNSGMLCFRTLEIARAVSAQWRTNYEAGLSAGMRMDEPNLALALQQLGATTAELPQKFNSLTPENAVFYHDLLPAIPVPKLTQLQLRLVLADLGIGTEKVQAFIDAIPDAKQRAKAQAKWEYSDTIRHNDPLVLVIGSALKMDQSTIDQAFREGATL